MKEHEFKCKKCGNTWYATDKDIRESRKQQSNIQKAKLQNVSGFRGKKYTKRSAEIARMQETQSNQDPYRCSSCGSRDVEIVGESEIGKNSGDSTLKQKIWTALAILFMPYLGIALLLWKKPFSPRTNRNCAIYCAAMTCLVIVVTAISGNQKEPSGNQGIVQEESNSNQGATQGNVAGDDVQKDNLVYDVAQFSKISGAELIAILGQPDSVDEGKCNGAFEIPCVYYDYNNAEGLGEVSFVLVNNSIVRFTSYQNYPFTDGDAILAEFGIEKGENCVTVANTDVALRYRCPADGIDDFRAELIDGDTFGYLQVTYDMSFYEEWYLPVSMGDRVNYTTLTEYTVKSLLKSPKSADFAGVYGWNFGRNQHYVAVQSYVDAQNSFGAEIRSEFTFIYFADTSTIAYAVFDGEVIADNGYTKTADIVSELYDAQKQSEALASASVG